jgi:predicted ATPase
MEVSANADSSSNKEELSGITYHAKCRGAVNESLLRLKADGFEIQQTIKGQNPSEIKGPGAFFIHGRRATSAGETADILTKLFESKEETHFVDALRRINPRISRVIPAIRNKQPMIFFDLGMSRLMPMNLLGDGFCRVCLMLTGLVSHKSKTLIVDEIDSGLHTTVMEDFWSSLLQLAEAQGVQIFCTTHSEEMLNTAVTAFRKSSTPLNVIRIDKCNDITTAQGYDLNQLEYANKANLDVR